MKANQLFVSHDHSRRRSVRGGTSKRWTGAIYGHIVGPDSGFEALGHWDLHVHSK
jgi:hypothetical protein